MTAAQTIQVKLSSARQRLNELLQVETRSAEEQTEMETLTAEVSAKEPELRAALAAEPDPEEIRVDGDAETRELRQLTERANVGDILSATFEKRQTSGESAELQKHHGLGSHQIPLEMLRVNSSVEERAAATVPAGIADASQGEVITPVFSSGDGAFLGIERPTVPVSDAAFPILSTMPSVKGPFTDSTEAGQTDAEFVATNLSPERLQASFSYRRTDAARFAGLDASLRLALNGGLQEKLDQQAIERYGWFVDFHESRQQQRERRFRPSRFTSAACFTAVIDGRYARTPGDVRMIVGAGNIQPCVSAAYKGNQQRRIRR